MGATIKNIDSKDINLFSNLHIFSSNYFKSHAYLYLIGIISLQLYIILSKEEKNIKKKQLLEIPSYLLST